MSSKNRTTRSLLAIVVVICSAMFCMGFTCQKRSKSPVIARVGNSILTLDDLYERIPPEYSDRISREQMINYVKQWMDTELLFQEALKQNIQKEDEIKRRLGKMKRDLLSAEVISRNSFAASKYHISDDAIATYYEEHKEEFVRESDVVKCMEIVVDNLKTAWSVRNAVTSDNFLDLAVRYSKAPVQDPRTVPYVSVEELPGPIQQIVPKIRINGTTSPIKTDNGYHIVRVLDKQKAGDVCGIEEVRDEIVGTLSSEAQKRHLDRLLRTLRLKVDFEYDFDIIPGAEDSDSEEPAS